MIDFSCSLDWDIILVHPTRELPQYSRFEIHLLYAEQVWHDKSTFCAKN